MTYTMVVEVGTKQVVIPFTPGFDENEGVQVDHLGVQRVLNLWKDQQPQDGSSHFVIDRDGEVRVYYTEAGGKQVCNDAQLDGNWLMPLRWFETLIPGKVWWGQSIGQPNPSDIVTVTDVVDKLMAKYGEDDSEPKFTWLDLKLAAEQAAFEAVAAS